MWLASSHYPSLAAAKLALGSFLLRIANCLKQHHTARNRPTECSGCVAAGHQRQACVFSTSTPGQAAQVTPSRGQTSCPFCSADVLGERLANARGKGVITGALAFFREHSPESIFPQAVQRIQDLAGAATWNECEQRLQRHLHQRGATARERSARAQQQAEAQARRHRGEDPADWASLLESRQAQFASSSDTVTAYDRAAQVNSELCNANFQPSTPRAGGRQRSGKRSWPRLSPGSRRLGPGAFAGSAPAWSRNRSSRSICAPRPASNRVSRRADTVLRALGIGCRDLRTSLNLCGSCLKKCWQR